MIKIITDSTASVSREYAQQHDIAIVPLKINIGEREFIEGTPDTYQEFYDAMLASREFPKTTQPSTQEYIDAFQKVVDDGNEAIVFCIGSYLSGSYNGACLAAKQVDGADEKITVVDSNCCSQTTLMLIEEAIADIEKGLSRDEVVANIEKNIKTAEICFCPDNLEYLKRGGRLGKVSAVIGTILKIKPLLSFKENTLKCVHKVMGIAKAIPLMISRIPENAKKIYALSAVNSKYFAMLLAKVKERFPNREICTGDICPVVSSHVGPAVGVSWIE